MKNKKENLIILTFFLIFVFVLFGESIITGKMVFGHDAVNIYMAFTHFAQQMIHKYHSLPSWIREIYFGMPMIASSSLLFFYPTDLIFILLNIPYHKVYTFDLIIHLFIAFLGMYLYLRKINLAKLSSYFGGFAVMMSGFILSYIYAGHINNIKAGALIPFAFYFAHRSFNEKKLKYFLLTSLVLALQIFATGMQIMAYTMLGILFYLIYFLVIENDSKEKTKLIFYFIILCLFSLLFSAMQFLPSLNYTNYSWRGDFSYNDFVSWSFHPFELITFLLPDFFGLYNETYWGYMPFVLTTYYFGITAFLILPFFTFSKEHKKLSLFLIISIVIFTILSFGKYGLLYSLFYYVPVFNQFRNPSRFFYLVTFFIIVLSSIGVDVIIKSRDEKIYLIKRLKWIVYSLTGFTGIFIMLFLSGSIKSSIISSYLKLKGNNIDILILDKILNGIKYDLLFFIIFSVIVLILLFLFAKNKIKSVFIFVLILIFINFLDGYRIQRKFIKFEEFDKFVPATHQIIEELKKDKEPYRVMNFEQVFGPNRGIYYGIESTGGLHGLAPKLYMELLQNGGLNRLNVNRFFNVKYYLIDREINIPDFVKIASFNNINLYKDTKVQQRLFTSNKVIKVNNDKMVMQMMLSDLFTGKEIILTDDFKEQNMDEGKVIIKKYLPNKIQADVETKNGTFVINSTSYYKNWKVLVDGKAYKLYKANYNAMAVYVPAGIHSVVFYYDAFDIYLGIFIGLVVIIFFIVILLFKKDMCYNKKEV